MNVYSCGECGGVHKIELCPSREDPKLQNEDLLYPLTLALEGSLSFLETALDSNDPTKVRTYLGDCKRIQRALLRLTK